MALMKRIRTLLQEKSSRLTEKLDLPNGVHINTPKGDYYLKSGKRYRIISKRILDSWKFPLSVYATAEAVAHYKVVGRLGFRAGTLLYSISDGRIWLVEDNKKRHIVSPDILGKLGASINDAITVSDTELALHEIGENIS